MDLMDSSLICTNHTYVITSKFIYLPTLKRNTEDSTTSTLHASLQIDRCLKQFDLSVFVEIDEELGVFEVVRG